MNKKTKKKNEIFCNSGKTSAATPQEMSLYKELVEEIQSWDLESQLSAVTNIRKLLSAETKPPINAFINVGVVPPLVQCLSSTNQELQHEAAWCLTNIASGNVEQTKHVVEAGAVPYFIKILNDGNNKLCEQVLWGLANISTDNNHRELLFEKEIILEFKQLLNSNLSNNALKEVAQIIVNLSETKIFIKDFQKTADFLSLILKLLQSDEDEVLRKALLAIVKLTDRGPEIIQFFLENDECANVLCNAIMCAKKEQVQYLFNAGIGDSLCSFIESPNPEIIKIIIFDLSSILEILDEVYQEIPQQIKASLQKSKETQGFTDPKTVELLRHFLEEL
uniref:Uncharacterized protein n=1 Tax=Panagrolaimus sp. ES5 TaxID=591445 RepID=A0AC34F2V1_9BILA